MATIKDMGYGTSKEGVSQLLEEIKSHLIEKVSQDAANIDGIKNACDENWVGTSKENFITNLQKDIQVLQDGLNQMYSALGTEINAASAAIMDFDQNLIKEN